MCAIFGLFSPAQGISAASVEDIAQVLRHRGPDDEGFLAVDLTARPFVVTSLRGSDSIAGDDGLIQNFTARAGLFLGHRRLSILDLSPTGHQPMRFGQDLWIVFNGEVYNYLEIR